jgi:benzylsuccinate CoA-transferase BbsF subunit
MDLVGRPDLGGDPSLSTAQGRRGREEEIEEVIGVWAAGLAAGEIETRCQAAGVPAHRASRSADFVADTQLAHRGHLVRLAHPRHGEVVVEGPRYLLSDTPGRVERPGPAIGQDSVEALGLIGMTPEEIRELDERGAIR